MGLFKSAKNLHKIEKLLFFPQILELQTIFRHVDYYHVTEEMNHSSSAKKDTNFTCILENKHADLWLKINYPPKTNGIV